jgi:hypothetical protein
MKTSENIQKVLNYFCAVDSPNPLINAPQKQNGYYYATNSNVLIRIKTDFDLGIDENPKAPAYERLIQPANLTPAIKLDLSKMYNTIDNTSNVNVCSSIECDECRNGTFDHGSHTYDCKNCDGAGSLDGEVVKIEKERYAFFYLTVNGEKVIYSANVLNYLVIAAKTLGITEWELTAATPRTPSVLIAENCLVLLMPYLIDDDIHGEYIKGSIDNCIIN